METEQRFLANDTVQAKISLGRTGSFEKSYDLVVKRIKSIRTNDVRESIVEWEALGEEEIVRLLEDGIKFQQWNALKKKYEGT